MSGWRNTGGSHDYVVSVSGGDSLATWKAAEHLKFTMHWDRSFMSVTSEDPGSDASEYVIHGYGNWKNMLVDMSNFTNYHPHATFKVTVDDEDVFTFFYTKSRAT